jgi:hypothetical protein
MPEEYEKWVDAQLFSERASREYANFQNLLVPIDVELKKPHVIETIWKFVNLVHFAPCFVSSGLRAHIRCPELSRCLRQIDRRTVGFGRCPIPQAVVAREEV